MIPQNLTPHHHKIAKQWAMRATLVVGFVAAAISFVVFSVNASADRHVFFDRGVTIGTLLLPGVILVALPLFAVAYSHGVAGRTNGAGQTRQRRRVVWWDAMTLSIAYCAMFGLMAAAVIAALPVAFPGGWLYPELAAAFCGVALGLIAYVAVRAAMTVITSNIIVVLFVLLGGGLLLTMFTTSDHDWLLKSLSDMGGSNIVDRWKFNLTMIVSGIAVAALTYHAFADLELATNPEKEDGNPWRARLVKCIYYVMAVVLIGIGVFHHDTNSALHGICAFTLVIAPLVLIALFRWALPALDPAAPTPSRLYVAYTYGTGLLILTGCGLFQFTAYFRHDIAGIELYAFPLSFVWLATLLMHIHALRKWRLDNHKAAAEAAPDSPRLEHA